MATTTDGATQQASAKGSSPQESMYETPDQYDMDDIEDSLDDGAGDEIVRRGHTKNDRKDMNRMGKRQELIVCFPAESGTSIRIWFTDLWEVEKLPAAFCPKLCPHPASYLGVYVDVSQRTTHYSRS
ncbi:hypothetical protein RJ035_005655 [Blastomyces gilchristii]